MRKVTLNDAELRAELASGLEGEAFESAEVMDGVVKVRFADAPGVPDGWSVDLTATGKGVEARYHHTDGRLALAFWAARRGRARLRYPESFASWPATYSESMWSAARHHTPECT